MIWDPVHIPQIVTGIWSETGKSRLVPNQLPGLARPVDITTRTQSETRKSRSVLGWLPGLPWLADITIQNLWKVFSYRVRKLYNLSWSISHSLLSNCIIKPDTTSVFTLLCLHHTFPQWLYQNPRCFMIIVSETYHLACSLYTIGGSWDSQL